MIKCFPEQWISRKRLCCIFVNFCVRLKIFLLNSVKLFSFSFSNSFCDFFERTVYSRSVFRISVCKVPFETKSILLYNFGVDYYPKYRGVFEISTLVLNFPSMKHIMHSHLREHSNSTISRHNLYQCIFHRSIRKGVRKKHN